MFKNSYLFLQIRKNFSGAIDYEEQVKKEGIVVKDLPVSKFQKLQTKEFKVWKEKKHNIILEYFKLLKQTKLEETGKRGGILMLI